MEIETSIKGSIKALDLVRRSIKKYNGLPVLVANSLKSSTEYFVGVDITTNNHYGIYTACVMCREAGKPLVVQQMIKVVNTDLTEYQYKVLHEYFSLSLASFYQCTLLTENN